MLKCYYFILWEVEFMDNCYFFFYSYFVYGELWYMLGRW